MKGKSKPIIEMDDLERTRMWDEVSKPLHDRMLDDARAEKDQVPYLAAVALTVSPGEDRVVMFDCEYGDGEAWNRAREFVREIRRSGSLRPGEKIRAKLWEARLVRAVKEFDPSTRAAKR